MSVTEDLDTGHIQIVSNQEMSQDQIQELILSIKVKQAKSVLKESIIPLLLALLTSVFIGWVFK
jgi:hypothetical protein